MPAELCGEPATQLNQAVENSPKPVEDSHMANILARLGGPVPPAFSAPSEYVLPPPGTLSTAQVKQPDAVLTGDVDFDDPNNIHPVRFLNEVRRCSGKSEQDLEQNCLDYVKIARAIGGPLAKDLGYDDVFPWLYISNAFIDKSWDAHVKSTRSTYAHEYDRINPYLPFFAQRDETKVNHWGMSHGIMSPEYHIPLVAGIREHVPNVVGIKREDTFKFSPCNDELFESLLAERIANMDHTFIWANTRRHHSDSDNEMWVWGSCLTFLAGFGLRTLRAIAAKLDYDPCWQRWAGMTDAELTDEIVKARDVSGFGAGIVWTPFEKLRRCIDNTNLVDSNNKPVMPRYAKPMVALHMLKHVRYWESYDGETSLVVRYKGRSAVVAVGSNEASLSASANKGATGEILKVLGLSMGSKGSKDEDVEWDERAVRECVRLMYPTDFIRPQDLRLKPHYIPPPSATVRATNEHRVRLEYSDWVNPGTNVANVCEFDVKTGTVTHDALVKPSDVLNLRWPFGKDHESDIKTHLGRVPKRIDAVPASDIIQRFIRNLNDLGYPRGLRCWIDALVTVDLYREDCLGTRFGSALQSEFPIVYVLPTGYTMETTTGQGKTSLCRALGAIMVTGLEVNHFMPSPSAPAQRSMASPIEKYGTAIMDEFQLPLNPEHFMAKEGLQNMSTGGIAHPGRAQENAQGVRLRHALFVCGKFAPDVKDVRTRSMPLFLDLLNEKTKVKGDELEDLMSGAVGMLGRLCHLRWGSTVGLFDMLKALKLEHGPCRFNGHQTVAYALADLQGIPREEVDGYYQAAQDMWCRQRHQAEESGLAEEVAGNATFSAHWYWRECDTATLSRIRSQELNSAGQTTSLNMIRCLVENHREGEDRGQRSFHSMLRNYKIQERIARKRLLQALRETGPWTRADGYSLAMDPNDQTMVVLTYESADQRLEREAKEKEETENTPEDGDTRAEG